MERGRVVSLESGMSPRACPVCGDAAEYDFAGDLYCGRCALVCLIARLREEAGDPPPGDQERIRSPEPRAQTPAHSR